MQIRSDWQMRGTICVVAIRKPFSCPRRGSLPSYFFYTRCQCFELPASKSCALCVWLGWYTRRHKVYIGSSRTSLHPVCDCSRILCGIVVGGYKQSREGARSITPEAAGLLTDVEYSRIRDSAWHVHYPDVNTRIELGLVK